MVTTFELESLKTKAQELFQRKQELYQQYAETRDRANDAWQNAQNAYAERRLALEGMNREFETLREAEAKRDEIWAEFEKTKRAINIRIGLLRQTAASEHQKMKDCFALASKAYEGKKDEASLFSSMGHDHKDHRNSINSEISSLIQDIREAREAAIAAAPKIDRTAFLEAKRVFEEAKARHEAAQAEFKRLVEERNQLKAAFDAAHAEHARLKDEIREKYRALRS